MLFETAGAGVEWIELTPVTNILYCTPYIWGFQSLARRYGFRIRWLRSGSFRRSVDGAFDWREDFTRFYGRVRKRDGSSTRFLIDPYDNPAISPKIPPCIDFLFKLNYDAPTVAALPEPLQKKVVPLGPSFPIRIWSGLPMFAAIRRALLFTRGDRRSFRYVFRSIYHQHKTRQPVEYYERGGIEDGPVFFEASYWKGEDEVTAHRVKIVKTCKKTLGSRFEGGIYQRPTYDFTACPEIEIPRTPSEVYFDKWRRSPVVFNTRGELGCLTWRLPEALAMGKAILSTPLHRTMPVPLEHGVHVHFLREDLSDLEDALKKVLGDESYRLRLKENARAYYDRYLKPESVCGRILALCEGRAPSNESAAAFQPVGASVTG